MNPPPDNAIAGIQTGIARADATRASSRGARLLSNAFASFKAASTATFGDASLLILFIGATAASIQAGILVPVVPLFLMSRGFSYLQLGFAFALIASLALIFRFLLAARQDIVARPWIVLLLGMSPAAAYPLLLIAKTPAQAVTIMAATTATGIVYGWGYQTLVGQRISRENMSRSFALSRVANDAAYALGVAAGGFLMAASFAHVFYVASLTAALSVVISASLLHLKRDPSRGARRAASHHLRSPPISSALLSLRHLRSRIDTYSNALIHGIPLPQRALLNVNLTALHTALFGTALFMYPVFFPLLLVSEGLTFQLVGIVVAASWIVFGLAELVGSTLADITGRHKIIVVSSLIAGAILNVVMWMSPIPLLIAGWIALGIADGMGRPVISTIIATSIPRRAIGFGFAITESVQGLTRVFAPLLFAVIISTNGLRNGLLVAAVLTMLSALCLACVEALPTPSKQTPGGNS